MIHPPSQFVERLLNEWEVEKYELISQISALERTIETAEKEIGRLKLAIEKRETLES